MTTTRNLVLLLIFLTFTACVRTPQQITRPEDALAPARLRAALVDDADFRDLAAAVQQSMDYYRKLPPTTQFVFGPDRATAADLLNTLQVFFAITLDGTLSNEQKLSRISSEFVLYRAAGGDKGKVLFTGYYEPLLSCRVARDDTYRYPLYRRPDDLLEIDLTQFGVDASKNKIYGRQDNRKVVPYYTRDEIDRKNALSGKQLEILWCSDLVDISVLQVQGSGKADLGNGNVVSVLYDAANGRPYKSVGKYLIDAGVIPKENMSLPLIREYLRSNPDRTDEILSQNPSYVFFRLGNGPSVGNIGEPLTPGRSIATDSKLFPKGALAFIATQKPVIENNVIKTWTPFSRFVLNQDTGGAIKGAGRVDIFFGPGPEAELAAGNLQHEGELYFLLKKK
jgi:membrane-bound lytic murein transglycosylase A